jgi:hypothetical protein
MSSYKLEEKEIHRLKKAAQATVKKGDGIKSEEVSRVRWATLLLTAEKPIPVLYRMVPSLI